MIRVRGSVIWRNDLPIRRSASGSISGGLVMETDVQY